MRSIDPQTYLSVFDEKRHALRRLVQDLSRSLQPPKPEEFIRGLELIIDAVETFLRSRVENLNATLASKPLELSAQIVFYAKVALQILGNLHEQYLPLLHAESQRNEYLFKPSIDKAIGLSRKVDLS